MLICCNARPLDHAEWYVDGLGGEVGWGWSGGGGNVAEFRRCDKCMRPARWKVL